MNVLLVDDDRFVVAALEKKINWEQLTVTEVLTAFNIRQAQKIIEKNSIDICVCDIEMPGDSGLDLLSWVRESGKEIQFIFLTSYADFDYAKKAIELSSLDYQLKPIDFDTLSHILEKAVSKVRKNAALTQTKADSQKWKDNYRYIVDLFWKELFATTLFREPSLLETELRKKDLSYTADDLFIPVLFRLYPLSGQIMPMESSMVDFSFQNITAETFQKSCILYESIVILNTFEYVVILSGLQLEQIRQPFTENLLTLFKNLQSFLHCEIACGIAPEVSLTELPETLTRLREMRESNLNSVNKPLFLQDFVPSTTSYIPPSLEVINTFLEQKQADAALQNIENYLSKYIQASGITKNFLLHLRLDIEQIVFSYLHKNGIEAHTLFSSEERDELITKSLDAVPYMFNYLRYLIQRAVEYNSFVNEKDSVVDIVLNYIHQHYSEDISRTMLADMVYLNPDYLARLFKKQTQTSIINYITTYRLEKAKELLLNPDIPVGTVALKVGYGNYSYFSKLFKDVVGCTPNEYRKK